MHRTPLGKFREKLLHRPSDASPGAEREGEPIAFGMEGPLVLRFVEEGLDPADEARLAEEVAKTLPLRWSLPTRALERLDLLSERLGGERKLLEWLDGHPGLPRVTARLLVLADSLDRYTDDPAVVTAVRDFRSAHGLPDELRGVLPPPPTPRPSPTSPPVSNGSSSTTTPRRRGAWGSRRAGGCATRSR